MKNLSFVRAAIATCAFAFTAHASSAVLQVNSNGILIGARDVDVSGQLYDVTFFDGNCLSIFGGCDAASDFMFKNQSDATLASHALLNQVFRNSPAGSFDSLPSKTLGCSDNHCLTLVPYAAHSGTYFAMSARNSADNLNDDVFGVFAFASSIDFENNPNYNFAKFQLAATAIPEPSSIALMGLAFAGLAASRRRKS